MTAPDFKPENSGCHRPPLQKTQIGSRYGLKHNCGLRT